MIVVELPLVVALVVWARWLGRKYGVPRWVRSAGWPIAAVWGVAAFGTVYQLVASFGAVSTESADPAQKARVLAEGISEAMLLALYAVSIIVVGIVLLLVLTWRYHWSVKPEDVPRNPPYR